MITSNILLFIFACFLLYFSGNWLIKGFSRIARFLGWKEFVVAFVLMAFASSLPNLFLGIFSAINGVPELSFGDVVGGDVIDLTLAIALAVLFSRGGISAESRTVQKTTLFTVVAALLPVALALDDTLSRIDGFILVSFFVFYISWLFSKEERFTKIYDHYSPSSVRDLKIFLFDLIKVLGGIFLLIVASQIIVFISEFFSQLLTIPIVLIGVLFTGFGNALPEIYFSLVSSKKRENWMVLGDLMGAVIVPSTLVLGIVALIQPIYISTISFIFIARTFLIIATLFFFFFVRTDRKITRREAIFLLFLYFSFVFAEVLNEILVGK